MKEKNNHNKPISEKYYKLKIQRIFEKCLNQVFFITTRPNLDKDLDLSELLHITRKGFKADLCCIYEISSLYKDSEGEEIEFIIASHFDCSKSKDWNNLSTVIDKNHKEFQDLLVALTQGKSVILKNLLFQRGVQIAIPIMVRNKLFGFEIIHFEQNISLPNIEQTFLDQISQFTSNYLERIKMAEENQIFQQGFEQSFSSILVTDANVEKPGPKVLYINDAFVRMTGYSREEFIGQSPRILQGKDTDPKVISRLKEQLKKGEPFHGNTTNYRKDGVPYSVEWKIAPIRDSKGRITHFVSAQLDITERLEKEKEISNLIKSEIGLAGISQILHNSNASEDVLEFALEQLLIFSKVTFVFLFHKDIDSNQYSISKIQTHRNSDRAISTLLLPEEWEERCETEELIYVNRKSSNSKENLFLDRLNLNSFLLCNLHLNRKSHSFLGLGIEDPLRVVQEVDLFLIRTSANLVSAFLERKINLEKIQNQKDNLEVLVEEKTHDLRIAKKKAESSNIAKSEFLANMTHELRTPLNSILGFARLIQPNFADPDQKKYLDFIYNSGTELLKMINDILDFSKLEAGKMELHLTKVPILEKVQKCLEIMTPIAMKKNIQFEIKTDKKDYFALADFKKIRQIIINLLTNAIKFSPNDSKILVSIESKTIKYYKFIMIQIQDFGIGIEEKDIPIIFERFSQLKEGKDVEMQGTGLGLPICKKLIELMNGWIEVDSKVKQGTSMKVFIPEFEEKK